MNLYLIQQKRDTGYDEYDSCVVAAETPMAAKKIHPNEDYIWSPQIRNWVHIRYPQIKYVGGAWASKPANVCASLIGSAKPGTKAGVILASFNAG